MCVTLQFADPFLGSREESVTVPLGADEAHRGLPLRAILERAGFSVHGFDGTLDPELSALVVVNGRAVAPETRFDTVVRDGDVVSFQLMLTGG